MPEFLITESQDDILFLHMETAISGQLTQWLYLSSFPLRSPAEGEGNEGFPPPLEKDLESLSSTRLEALVPSRDSRAMTRSPSPRAWRPDFPGAAREAP